MPDHPLLVSLGHKPRKGTVLVCPSCKIEFYVGPVAALTKKFCSVKCSVNRPDRKLLQKPCKQCGSTYTVYPSQIKWHGSSFCSKTCEIRSRKERAATPAARSHRRQMHSGQMRSLDNLFSKIVRLRGTYCQKCGTDQNLHASHVIPRTFLSVRWDLDNAITLCYRDHIYWWHKHPLEAAAWFEDKWPGRFDILRARSLSYAKMDRAAKLAELRKLYEELAKNYGITEK